MSFKSYFLQPESGSLVLYPALPRFRRHLALGLCGLLLAACAHQPQPRQVETPAPEAPPEPAYVFDRPFETETLYALLVAEMAGERQRFDVMLSNYVQQAETTGDPQVTARAARLARYLNAHGAALKMASLWLTLEPDNGEAHYIMAAELVHENRLQEAVKHAEFLLEQGETSGLDAIAARAQQTGDPEVSAQLLPEYQRLAGEHPNEPAVLIGISLLYQHTGNLEQALQYIQATTALQPEDFQAAAQETRLLQEMGRGEEAQQKLADLVERHPQNPQLRLQYARSLLKTDLPLAQQQFEKLLEAAPDDADLLLTLALIEFEREAYEPAKSRFTQLLDSKKHRSTGHYYLGRLALLDKNETTARDHFAQVEPGSDYLPALAQLTELMLAKGEKEQALNLVRDKRRQTPEQRMEQIEGLFLLEAHLLSSQNQLAEALAPLQAGIDRFPKSTKLIYTRAMLFTRLDDLPKAEADFKRVLTLAPENAAALNALGYTLADRTDRLEEAYQYIREAYRLAPDDPAVMDSLGWVEYLRGNHEAALKNLRNAMELMPDHEIAAHLGEVLWVTGNKKEAQQVWRRGLDLQPDSPVILNTIQRLKAAP
jgi:tetratricopeptide (TPR) repeat protein